MTAPTDPPADGHPGARKAARAGGRKGLPRGVLTRRGAADAALPESACWADDSLFHEAERGENSDNGDGDGDEAATEVKGAETHDAELLSSPSTAALPLAITDAQLTHWITAISHRDEKALAALYDAVLPRVYGLVLKIVRTNALAEEVVEETFFQVWRQALRFDPSRGAPMAWLLGMARSRAIDGLRKEARFQHQGLDTCAAAEVTDGTPTADDLLDVARGHAELHRALMLLNAQPRQLMALAFFRGLSHEEIASQTQLPLGTVKSQIRRALLVLRQSLGDAGLPAWVS